MSRPTTPTLPNEGLLVGWSLEGEPRKKVVGFHDTRKDAEPARVLEPILHTGGGHLVTVAPTGAGKGVGCIIPALLRYPGPVVVIDPKGENYWVTARRRRELGQKVIALDPFRILNLPEDERGRFNPLDFLSPKNPSLVEDAEMISRILMASAGTQHQDTFWPFMGGQLLTLLLLYQVKKLDPSHWTLSVTRELLSRSPAKFAELGAELLKDDDPALRRLAGVVAQPAESTFGGYWAFSQMQTACLKGELVGECIGSSSFSLQELVDGDPLSIYLVIPPEKLESHGNLLKVWLSVMIAALTNRRSRPEHPTLFIVDEAAQLGHMPQLRQAITLLRGYGVRVWSFWQDLSQLKGLYPQTWETILNNSRVQQYFGQVTRIGAAQTHEMTGFASPAYLQTLQQGEMVLKVHGDEPVISQVPNYRFDACFEELYDANPYHEEAPDDDETVAIGRSTRVFRRSDFRKKGEPDPAGARKTLHTGTLGFASAVTSPEPMVEEVPPESKAAVLDAARKKYEGLDGVTPDDIDLQRMELPFYQDATYYELRIIPGLTRGFAQFLHSDGAVIPFVGDSDPIHAMNDENGLRLEAGQVHSYLRFFCSCAQGEEGRFLIVEKPSDLRFAKPVSEEYEQTLTEIISPMSLVFTLTDGSSEPLGFRTTATVLYGNSLFQADFEVNPDGQVKMVDDEELLSDIPVVTDDEAYGRRLKVKE